MEPGNEGAWGPGEALPRPGGSLSLEDGGQEPPLLPLNGLNFAELGNPQERVFCQTSRRAADCSGAAGAAAGCRLPRCLLIWFNEAGPAQPGPHRLPGEAGVKAGVNARNSRGQPGFEAVFCFPLPPPLPINTRGMRSRCSLPRDCQSQSQSPGEQGLGMVASEGTRCQVTH